MTAKKIAIGIMLAVACVVFATFLDYGVTWDEAFHLSYGKNIANWFQTFFHDRTAVENPVFIYYGGIFDFFTQLAIRILPFGIFETRHLLGSLLGLWTILISWKTTRHIAGDTAGLFTVILLSEHPVFYGHMFANPVDIPFGAFFITAIYYCVLFYENLPAPPRALFIKLSVATGLALGIRVSGASLFFPVFLLCLALWKLKFVLKKRFPADPKPEKHFWNWNYLWLPGLAWPAMILCWPWAQLNPLVHPFLAMLRSANWKWRRLVFFEGNWYLPTELPKTYLFKSILISTPEFFLAALVTGFIGFAFYLAQKKGGDEKQFDRAAKLGLICCPVILSFGGNFFLQKTQFDGFRHFLFLIPLLAVIGGISLGAFFKSGFWKPAKITIGLLLCFSLGLTAWDIIRLHPYQTVYFNRMFAGGLQGAILKYETDYWGSSYKEGIEWVMKNYQPDFQRKIRVQNGSAMFQTGYYLIRNPQAHERFEMVDRNPDLYLSTTRWGFHQKYPGKILYIVKRDQVPLLYVIEVEKTPPQN